MPGLDGGLGRDGGPSLDGDWAWGGGRECFYIKTCLGIGQNAVSELNTKGKIQYFLLDFPREVPDISLVFPDFS